jgi:hypothetical protein
MTLLFVGEKRSNRAIELKVTWKDGALAGKQLFDALHSIGIDPHQCNFCNIFERGGKSTIKQHNGTIIGMGKKVQIELDRLDIPHVKIIHPAARGKIRKKELYIAHVRDALSIL